MADQAARLAREITDLQRRLRSVERGSQAPRTSVQVNGAPVTLGQTAVSATEAQTRAAEAVSEAQAAYVRAEAAEGTAEAVSGTAAAAQTAADTAAADAATALSSAQAAGTDAVAAQTAADQARTAADAAQVAADQAGTVAAQADADAADAAADAAQALADAAAAASAAATAQTAANTAQTRANDAYTRASTAISTADSAVLTANGKNTITYSTAAPTTSTPGKAVGDLWFRRNSAGQVFETYEWGTAWTKRIFTDAVMASLTAGKITTGTLQAGVQIISQHSSGSKIVLAGDGFYKVEADGRTSIAFIPGGDSIFTGTITGSEVISSDYIEAIGGWRLAPDGRAEFGDVQVTQGISAYSVSASEITLQGQNLTQLLDVRPAGLVAQGINEGINLQGKVNECGIAEIGFMAYPGRAYELTIKGPEYASSDAATSVGFFLRFTNNGDWPKITSPVVTSLGQEFGGFSAGRFLDRTFLWYPPLVNNAPTQIRVLLSFLRTAGSGTVGVNSTGGRALQMFVKDVGPALPNSVVANHHEITTGYTPPPPPAQAPQAASETFYATWGASYLGSNGKRSSGSWLYQGQASGNPGGNGNQRSMWGFDLTYVRSRLAGATIKSAVVYGRAAHTYANSGGTAVIGSHGNDVEPATWGGPALLPDRARVGVPNGGWFACDALGVMNEIKNSQASGFTFGPAPTTDPGYYAYFYGAGEADRPRVVVSWEK